MTNHLSQIGQQSIFKTIRTFARKTGEVCVSFKYAHPVRLAALMIAALIGAIPIPAQIDPRRIGPVFLAAGFTGLRII